MNVKPLFHYDESILPEDLVQFLDLPNTDPKKRAFLDACKQHPKLARAWVRTKRLNKAGASLPNYEPSNAVRSQILQQAQAFAQSDEFKQIHHRHQNGQASVNADSKTTELPKTKRHSFSGYWKYAWRISAAATFLVVSLTAYHLQNQPTGTTERLTFTLVAQVERLDDELYQLEEDLDLLSMSMGLTRVPAPMAENQDEQNAG